MSAHIECLFNKQGRRKSTFLEKKNKMFNYSILLHRMVSVQIGIHLFQGSVHEYRTRLHVYALTSGKVMF